MEFTTAAQRKCYMKVKRWITELFGEIAAIDQERPLFAIPCGSAVVSVSVNSWSADDAVINTKAFVVTNGNLTPELMYFLLCKNAEMRFGAFGIDGDGEIIFEHNIVGSTCDKEELNASIIHVLTMADKYDDQIIANWGGYRAIDLLVEMREAVK